MGKKKLLKDMELSSVDLCSEGCNPKADIKLYKSRDAGDNESLIEKIKKAVTAVFGGGEPTPEEQMEHIAKAWADSAQSIWNDAEISAQEREAQLRKSRDELTAFIDAAIPKWAGTAVEKASDDHEKNDEPETGEGETDMASIDLNKMDAKDRETVLDILSKYGPEDPNKGADGEDQGTEKCRGRREDMQKGGNDPEDEQGSDPESDEEDSDTPAPSRRERAPYIDEEDDEEKAEMKKALDDARYEIHQIKKAREIDKLTQIAKKYEPLGKNPEELAEKLYTVRSASDDAYNEVCKALDDQLEMQERSGIFKEFGSNRSGATNELETAVAEIRKSKPDISRTDAIELAYRNNPNLSEY